MFGPEQEEWKAAILAELESFAKLGVYETVKLSDIRGAEILPGRLVLVVKPNPEGSKGKTKARIVVCGNFQTVHQDVTLSTGNREDNWTAKSTSFLMKMLEVLQFC